MNQVTNQTFVIWICGLDPADLLDVQRNEGLYQHGPMLYRSKSLCTVENHYPTGISLECGAMLHTTCGVRTVHGELRPSPHVEFRSSAWCSWQYLEGGAERNIRVWWSWHRGQTAICHNFAETVCEKQWSYTPTEKAYKKQDSLEQQNLSRVQGSGTDCHVVATWLETILQNHLDRYGDLATLLWSGNKAMRLLYFITQFIFEWKWEEDFWSCREGVSLHLHAVGCRGAWTEWNVIQMPTKIPYDGASYRKSSICQLGKIICNLVRRRLVEEGCQNHEVLCCDYGASPGVGKMAFSYPCKYPQISTSRRKVKKMGFPTGWHRRLHGHTRIGGCGQY